MRTRVTLTLLIVLGLVLAPSLSAHGGEELAKQPAKILVQQALALLQAGQEPGEAVERLDAAEKSKDKSKVNAELLSQGHEALESGDIDGSIRLLRQALAKPEKKPAEPEERESAEVAPDVTNEPPPASPPSAPSEPPPASPEVTETAEPDAVLPPETIDEAEVVPTAVDELSDADAIHEAAETFRPDQSGQELAAAIGGGILLVLVAGGLAWRWRREGGITR